MRFASVRLSPIARAASRLRPGGFALFVIGAAVLGAGLVWARGLGYGVGLSWDSVNYISVARNLLEGEGFIDLDGRRPYSYWAPLYPMTLAAGGALGVDPQDLVRPLNAFAFGAAVIGSGLWLRERLESRFLAVWGALAVALSLPLAWAASVALATISLSALIALALIQIEKFLREQRLRALLLASVFSGLAGAVHYSGVVVIIFAAAALAFQPKTALITKAKRVAAYGTIASAPIGLWMIRNQLTTEYATGNRGYDSPSFFALLGDAMDAASHWAFVNLFVDSIYFGVSQWAIASLLTGVAMLALTLTVVYAFARIVRSAGSETGLLPFIVFAGFSIAFFLLLMLSVALGSVPSLEARYCLPAYIPLLLGVLFGLDRLLARIREEDMERAKRLSIGAFGALGLWLALSAALHPLAIREANAYGIARYDGLRDSEILRYVEDNAISGETQSNDTAAVYARTRGRLDPDWRIAPDNEGAVIIWFHDTSHPRYDAADFRGMPGVEAVADLSDGAVFRVDGARNLDSPHQSIYDALRSREPDARLDFDVYLDERTITYAKSPCDREDASARFFLHVRPARRVDLPATARARGFDNLDFSFVDKGARFDAKCITSVSLPRYPIDRISTGQFAGGARLWEATFLLPQ